MLIYETAGKNQRQSDKICYLNYYKDSNYFDISVRNNLSLENITI